MPCACERKINKEPSEKRRAHRNVCGQQLQDIAKAVKMETPVERLSYIFEMNVEQKSPSRRNRDVDEEGQ